MHGRSHSRSPCMSVRSLIAESFRSLQFLSVSCFHVNLGLPGPCFPSTCMWKAVLIAPLERSTCSYQRSLLSFRMRSRSSIPSRTSSSLDLVVAMSCGQILQICLIIALSFCCRRWGLVLSVAKSHWHGALRSAHKSCTHGHVSWKRGGMKRGLVAAPWTSSRPFSHILWLKVHSHLLLRACLLGSKGKLPPPACQVKHLSPLHFLCTQCLQPLQKMLLLPIPVRQTAHGNSPELCRRSRPVLQIMIFVFPVFTLSPFFSIASFQVKSLLTHSSSESWW